MKKIKDYEKKAVDILNRRYGIDPTMLYSPLAPQISIPMTEVTETISHLIMLDLIDQLNKMKEK